MSLIVQITKLGNHTLEVTCSVHLHGVSYNMVQLLATVSSWASYLDNTFPKIRCTSKEVYIV